MITVLGTPAQQGSKRFLGRTKLGKGIMVEASDKTAPWRSSVINGCAEYWREHNGGTPDPIAGAVIARVVFSFQRPVSVTRKKRPFMSVYPDLDKLLRATLDGLKAGGAFRDDALVVEFTRAAKVYCDEDPESLPVPGARITLAPLLPLEQLMGEGDLPRKEKK
jgi:Holliday junction resolvase RusA-like endonuclease